MLTSGNHDPAVRLDAPGAILSAHGCRVLGVVRRQGDAVHWGAHILALKDGSGRDRAAVAAIPFL